MMRLGSAAQMKDFGFRLVSAMKRLIAALESTIEWNTPRFGHRLVCLAKKPSIAFSHEHDVGTK